MTVMMYERNTKMSENEHKDVAALLTDALHEAGLTQYKLAQRLAQLRPCSQCGGEAKVVPFARRKAIPCPMCNGTGRSRAASQDQQLRRIRRFNQLPTEEYAMSLARAFDPDLDLPDDYFYTPRETAQQFREAAMEALTLLPELRQRVEALEAELRRRQNLSSGEKSA